MATTIIAFSSVAFSGGSLHLFENTPNKDRKNEQISLDRGRDLSDESSCKEISTMARTTKEANATKKIQIKVEGTWITVCERNQRESEIALRRLKRAGWVARIAEVR